MSVVYRSHIPFVVSNVSEFRINSPFSSRPLINDVFLHANMVLVLSFNLVVWSYVVKGWDGLLEVMKKARRLNNHVFSMLKARCPLEDKTACAIKQSGAPLHRVKFENTVSAFETLPQKEA